VRWDAKVEGCSDLAASSLHGAAIPFNLATVGSAQCCLSQRHPDTPQEGRTADALGFNGDEVMQYSR
jgi:hypothetical protein